MRTPADLPATPGWLSTEGDAPHGKRLRCPACRSQLDLHEGGLRCVGSCQIVFPVIDGVPVLINEARSIFTIRDYLEPAPEEAAHSRAQRLKEAMSSLIPRTSRNIKGPEMVAKLTELVREAAREEGRESGARPRLLVLGGRIPGVGFEASLAGALFDLVESDVVFGPRTSLICDAHDVPFEDGTFDAVIAQAVLEYLVDPYRCVEEIHRVLKPRGLVYAETPFMQQVHGGAYDFTRFTHLGQRRLFRQFEELDSGAVCGPGMTLAWSYRYFLMSLVRSKRGRSVASAFASLTSFWLPYLDGLLIERSAALDTASGCYFLGRRSEQSLSDRDLIKLYRGSVGRDVSGPR